MTYQLRPATAADIPRLVDLRHERSLAERTPFDADRSKAALYELLFQPNWGRSWVITSDSAIVGYVMMTVGFNVELGGQYGFFDEMYVQADHRGQDLGSRCLSLVEATSREMGLRHLMVGVSSASVRAQAMWRNLGFGDGPYQLMMKVVR
jgi:ribosomal protein S18 acetylase RimI-like enzyme